MVTAPAIPKPTTRKEAFEPTVVRWTDDHGIVHTELPDTDAETAAKCRLAIAYWSDPKGGESAELVAGNLLHWQLKLRAVQERMEREAQ